MAKYYQFKAGYTITRVFDLLETVIETMLYCMTPSA